MAAGSQDRGRDVLIMFHPSVLLRVFVSVNHSMFKVHTATVVQLFLRIFFVQVVKNNLNPVWKPFRIPIQSLCGGDVENPIKVNTQLRFHITNCNTVISRL